MSVLKLCSEYFKENQTLLWSQVCFTSFVFLFEDTIIPRIIGNLVTHLNDPVQLKKKLIQLFICLTISQVCYSISSNLYDKISISLDKFLSDRILNQVLLRMDQHPESVNIAHIHNVIAVLKESVDNLLYFVLSNGPRIITLIISSANLVSLNKIIGMIGFSITFIIIILYYNSIHSIDKNESRSYNEHLLYQIQDSFVNINTVRSIEKGIPIEMDKIKIMTKEHANIAKKQLFSMRKNQSLVYGCNLIIFGFIFYILYQTSKDGTIPSEQFTTLILSISPLFYQVTTLIYYMTDLKKAIIEVKFFDPWIQDIFSYKDSEPMAVMDPLTYQFNNMSFSYPGVDPIFTNYSITIPKGLVWLKGESGAGKSTFIKLLLGILKPTSGIITINGEIVTTMIKQNIVYLHQQAVNLFTITIYENIIYGKTDTPELRNQVHDLLMKYNLYSVFGSKEGDDSFMDKPVIKHGENLSGGQKQMIHLLRCILLDRSFYIMDEPLTGLDPDTKNRTIQLLTDLVESGKTIIIISHDPLHIKNQTVIQFTKGENPVLII